MTPEELKALRALLKTAIEADDTDSLEELLTENDIGINDKIFHPGKTLLMQTAESGASHCMQLLLSKDGIDVNAGDNDISNTALMYAVKNEKTECVRLLLARDDLNINAVTDDRNNVMDHAHMCKDIECLKLLLSHEGLDIYGLSNTSFSSAVFNSNPALVKLLILRGDLDVDAVDQTLTPLMLSARDNKPEFTKLLLEHGANPNIANDAGETAITFAIKNVNILDDMVLGDVNILSNMKNLKLLLAHGAEIPSEFEVDGTITTTPQTRLALYRGIKTAIKEFLDGNDQLEPDSKVLAEKIATSLIFAQSTTREQLQSNEFINNTIETAANLAPSIYQHIAGYDEATRTFIINNANFIDPFLDENFKNWKVSTIGLKKAIVNLAFICGDKVTGIRSLEKHSTEQVQKFIKSIPQNDDGTTHKYSVGEFLLDRQLYEEIENKFKPTISKLIVSFLGDAVSVAGEALASHDETATSLIGADDNGPAAEAE